MFMKKIGEGSTSEIFELDDSHILKLYHKKEVGKAKYEASIALEINALNIPSPRFKGILEVEDRLGLVYEKVEGLNLLEAVRKYPNKIKFFGGLFAEVHWGLHNLSLEKLQSTKSVLEKNIKMSPCLTVDLKNKSLEMLRNLPESNLLCHFDFHLKNVIITAKGPVVIDWACVMRGAPIIDVLVTSFYLRKSFFGTNPIFKAYIDRYIELSNVSLEEIESWKFPLMAALTNIWNISVRNQLLHEIDVVIHS